MPLRCLLHCLLVVNNLEIKKPVFVVHSHVVCLLAVLEYVDFQGTLTFELTKALVLFEPIVENFLFGLLAPELQCSKVFNLVKLSLLLLVDFKLTVFNEGPETRLDDDKVQDAFKLVIN
jgi:hypothetical protein